MRHKIIGLPLESCEIKAYCSKKSPCIYLDGPILERTGLFVPRHTGDIIVIYRGDNVERVMSSSGHSLPFFQTSKGLVDGNNKLLINLYKNQHKSYGKLWVTAALLLIPALGLSIFGLPMMAVILAAQTLYIHHQNLELFHERMMATSSLDQWNYWVSIAKQKNLE